MEVPLPTAQAFTDADPLNRRVVDQMLIGVATRQYARSLEPLGANITTRGTSKSAVSRRFVAQTQAQLDAWRATPLDALDLAVLLIDGVQVGGHCIVVALGIDTTGTKHPLGLGEGATENATVCQGLLTNLASRGLRTDRSFLVIVDGAKALETAVTQTFGRAAVVQRCQVHKGRNILEHLPEAQRRRFFTISRILATPSSGSRASTTGSLGTAPTATPSSRCSHFGIARSLPPISSLDSGDFSGHGRGAGEVSRAWGEVAAGVRVIVSRARFGGPGLREPCTTDPVSRRVRGASDSGMDPGKSRNMPLQPVDATVSESVTAGVR